ncbi:HAD hydrolase family protein [Vibrio harveyi]|nr:HAD hydrolase family protein [Vibrio harveyi]
MNIDYKKVITFGDNHNDIEMVSGVDKGYAMANAVEKLKRAAYQVCDTVENNGVGKELEKILNN